MAALTEQEILELFHKTGALLEGHFLLSSGLHSRYYIQCARLLQHPELAVRVCSSLAGKAKVLGRVDAVIGPAIGGIIVAHELARALGVRGMFTEREGERVLLRRGFEVKVGERILIAEDVVTTGRSSLEVAEAVAAQGGDTVGVACIVDRRVEDAPFPFPLIPLIRMEIETYSAKDCPLCRNRLPISKPGSRHFGGVTSL